MIENRMSGTLTLVELDIVYRAQRSIKTCDECENSANGYHLVPVGSRVNGKPTRPLSTTVELRIVILINLYPKGAE